MPRPRFFQLTTLFIVLIAFAARADDALLLAHYMPWFGSKETSGRWGWHWTMGKLNPEKILPDGRRMIASHDYPLIGPYDSGDAHALECHVLLMKFAGFDGVVVDWYGTQNVHDYAINHRNTERLIPWLKKAALRFAICYEDQAIGRAIKAGKLSTENAAAQGKRDLEWAEQNWLRDTAYVRLGGRPVLLVFGPQHFQRDDWRQLREALPTKPLLFGLQHLAKKNDFDGAFGWPPVSGGKTVSPENWRDALQRLHARQKPGEPIIATAFPGFRDFYEQAGVHASYGRIEPRDGKTFTETLDLALASGAPLVQIATWNDYGEGTVIEPTRDEGFRSLEAIQQCTNARRASPPRFTATDLRLAVALFELRKQHVNNAAANESLENISALLFSSDCAAARKAIEQLKSSAK